MHPRESHTCPPWHAAVQRDSRCELLGRFCLAFLCSASATQLRRRRETNDEEIQPKRPGGGRPARRRSFRRSASAADLGGNCCADLEERIAELEATTARKGNRKVSLTMSGWVAEQVTYWDDGVESNALRRRHRHDARHQRQVHRPGNDRARLTTPATCCTSKRSTATRRRSTRYATALSASAPRARPSTR